MVESIFKTQCRGDIPVSQVRKRLSSQAGFYYFMENFAEKKKVLVGLYITIIDRQERVHCAMTIT
jgi:hypothetical protein